MGKPTIWRVVRWIAYPSTMAAAFGLFYGLDAAGVPLEMAAFGGAALGGGLVLLHELILPYRRAWRPGATEVASDAVFLTLVQMLLPKLLAFLLISAIARMSPNSLRDLAAFWPHHWPVPLQAILMLLSADLLRYWLHRAASGCIS